MKNEKTNISRRDFLLEKAPQAAFFAATGTGALEAFAGDKIKGVPENLQEEAEKIVQEFITTSKASIDVSKVSERSQEEALELFKEVIDKVVEKYKLMITQYSLLGEKKNKIAHSCYQ